VKAMRKNSKDLMQE